MKNKITEEWTDEEIELYHRTGEITILSVKPVDKKMIDKMIKPKIIPLSEKIEKVQGVPIITLSNVKETLKNIKEELKEEVFHDICWDTTKEESDYSPSYFSFRNKLIKKLIKIYNKRIDKIFLKHVEN